MNSLPDIPAPPREGPAPPPDDRRPSGDGPFSGLPPPGESSPTRESPPARSVAAESPPRLGDFRIVREVGRGGMGVVYEAEQISLGGRRVALKVLPSFAAMDRRQLARFRVEAEAAALLNHPNIVPVFASGSDDGVHFYAMQFIEGRTLAAVIRERRGQAGPDFADTIPAELGLTASEPPQDDPAAWRMPPSASPSPSETPVGRGSEEFRAAARLGIAAAEALDYAHAQGVLHRDIKPSNLLIDARGQLWIADFGLARLAGGADLTNSGALVGTLRYMSPEQATSGRDPVDHRTDLYALGATLYELLTLRPAFDGHDQARLLRRIAEEDPIPPRRINPAIPRDLETIVLKAMARKPSDRYADAAELAEDLRRFLARMPVKARRPTWHDRAMKWLWRHRAPVTTAAAMSTLMAVGAVAALAYGNARLRAERDLADLYARRYFASQTLAERRARLSDLRLFADRSRQAQLALEAGKIEHAQDLLDSFTPDPPSFVDRYLRARASRVLSQLRGHEHDVVALAVSPADGRVASADRSGAILLWEADPGRPLARLVGHTTSVTHLAFSADGARLASAGVRPGDAGAELFAWEVASGRPLIRLDLPDATMVHGLSLPAGGRWLMLSARLVDAGDETQLFDLEAGARLREFDGRLVECPAGPAALALVARDGRVVALDLVSDATLWEMPDPGDGWHASASPEGDVLAITVAGRGVEFRDPATGAVLGRLDADAIPGHTRLGPGGRRAVALLGSREILIYDRAEGQARRFMPGDGALHDADITTALSPDGSTLAVSVYDRPGGQRPVTLVDAATGEARATFPGRDDRADAMAFAADGGSLLLNGGVTIRRWFLGRPWAEPPGPAGHADEAWAAAASPDGETVASGGDDTDEPDTIKIWAAADGRLIRGWRGHPATVAAMAFAPDGQALATVALLSEENARIWDPKTGRLLVELVGHAAPVRAVAFHPKGELVATGGDDRVIRLWDRATGEPRGVLGGHGDKVRQLAFSPDGLTLASSSNDRTVRLWDVPSLRQRAIFTGPERFAGLAYAPDGRAVAASDEDGDLFLLDAATGRRTNLIHVGEGELRAVAYSPDGRALAVAGMGRTIHLWDPESDQEMLRLEGHEDQVNALAFTPDGLTLVSCGHEGAVRFWRAEPDAPAPAPTPRP